MARQCLFSKFVPTHVKLPTVASAECFGHLMWRVRRTIRDVCQEGSVRRACLLLSNPGNSLIGKILAKVIALFRSPGWVDPGRAVVQNRHELIHLTAQKAIK